MTTRRGPLPTWAWVLIVVCGLLLLVCGGGAVLTWFATAELREIADLPEPERTRRLSQVVRKLAGDDDRWFLDFQRAVDAGRLGDAWDMTSAAFRERTDRAAFEARAEGIRASLGPSRELMILQFSRSRSSDRAATVLLEYRAVFEKGPATVRGALRAELSGAWTVESWEVERDAPGTDTDGR